jgi:hypothetical protein
MSELSVYGPGVRAQGLVLGGVNYCRSHCRLAKFRDYMYGEIQRCGWTNNAFLYVPSMNLQVIWFLSSQSQRCISACISNHEIFAKRQSGPHLYQFQSKT